MRIHAGIQQLAMASIKARYRSDESSGDSSAESESEVRPDNISIKATMNCFVR